MIIDQKKHHTDLILSAFENHYFEEKVAEYYDKGIVRGPIYLSQGTAHIPVILRQALAKISTRKYALFPQHRCHSYYLTFNEDKLEAMNVLAKELCGRVDGCGKGMTGSASLHIPNLMFGHDGLLGSNAPIACGFAQATNRPTICILGDAACEEDYVLSSFGYASHHKLPIVFLVEDNNLSILTKKNIRRSWDVCKVAESFGVLSGSIDDSANMLGMTMFFQTILSYSFVERKGPVLINVNVERHRWHSGSGIDDEPRFNSLYQLINSKQILEDTGAQFDIETIKTNIDFIWKELYNDIKRHNS